MVPPWAVRMARQMGSPSPEPAGPLPPRKNFSKTRSSVPGARPGPSSATSRTSVAASTRARDGNGGSSGGVLDRVVDDIHEHLLEQDAVQADERQVRGQSDLDGAVAEDAIEPGQGRADELLHRLPLAVEGHRSRLEACHVEEVADEAVEALGLVEDGVLQLPLSGLVEISGIEERARCAGDRGEGRPEVVGHRAEEGVSKPLALGRDAGLLGCSCVLDPLEARGGLMGQGLDEIELVRCQRQELRRWAHAEDAERRVGSD